MIRRFRPEDRKACEALWLELVDWHRKLYDDASIGPGSFADYAEEHDVEHVWVADEEGDVIGFAGLIVYRTKAELEPVVVAERARGRGFGRALVDAVVGEAQRLGVARVFVRPVARNAAAIAFFHELGFTALGHLELQLDFERPPDYWRAGESLAGREFRV